MKSCGRKHATDKMRLSSGNVLSFIYKKLFKAFGPQHWWPGDTVFEVIVGAILTQNTNWGNVEKAIGNLKKEKALSFKAFQNISEKRLAQLIKPSGYFNIKARRLKNFIRFVHVHYKGSLKNLQKLETQKLRQELLKINGIGPETADSILLYAFNRQVFVIDAYTKRIFSRHNIVEKNATYHHQQELFTSALRPDTKLYNEYHALIVKLAKHHCKTKPVCEGCPINELNNVKLFACRP